MSDPFIISRIQNLPLCQALTAEEVALLATAFQALRLAPEHVLFEQGQPSQGMYVFVYGSGVLSQNRPVGMVQAGQYINEGALFAATTESATLRIVEPALVLFLPRASLSGLVTQYPRLGASINAYLSGRARPANAPLVKPPPLQAAPPPTTGVNPTPPAPLLSPTPARTPARPPIMEQRQPITPPRSDTPAAPISQLETPGLAAAPPASGPQRVSAAPPKRLFEGQREDEEVQAQVWRHWWAFARLAWAPLCILIGLFILSGVVQVALLQLLFAAAAVLLPGLALVYLYREWRNDYLIVTRERVIWVERRILTFETRVRELPVESILEVTSDYPHFDPASRLLNYGTVKMRTAGDAGNLVLTMMPNPIELQKLIFSNRSHLQEVVARQQRDVIRREVGQMIGGGGAPNLPPAPPPPINTGAFHPLAMRFVNEKGETVYRKHWSVWLAHTFLPGVLILAGSAFAVFALTREADLRLLFLALSALPVLLGGLGLYWADWDWRNDMYIVGDEAVTLIHRRPLWLQNKVDKIILSQVDSIASDQTGLLNSLLNRGEVRLSLEGADAKDIKRFELVHNPRAVAAEVTARQAGARQKEQVKQAHQQRQAIADYLAAYHETVSGGALPPTRAQPGQPLGTRPPNAPRPGSGP
ncbi:MAG: cyclic nucleotide-binding domain-containing protein [Chloroflexi bacterium]|nr:cyclic nucleotide-binding domain-containing protein [Chloroflexota bacterium]